MFFIHLPKTFKVGDTADCRINREPARVTWRDKDHLVIEPNDARVIVTVEDAGNELNAFMCGDADTGPDDYTKDRMPGGVVVGRKP